MEECPLTIIVEGPKPPAAAIRLNGFDITIDPSVRNGLSFLGDLEPLQERHGELAELNTAR